MLSKTRILFLLTLSVFIITLFLLLPTLFNHWLVSPITKILPGQYRQLAILELTPWSLRLLADVEEDGLRARLPHMRFCYSPFKLLQGKIASLDIDSATIHLNDSLLQALLPQKKRDPSSFPQKAEMDFFLPVTINHLNLTNCTLVLPPNVAGERVKLFLADADFSLHTLKKDKRGHLVKSLEGFVIVKGDLSLRAGIRASLARSRPELSLELEISDITPLQDLPGLSEDLAFAGDLDANLYAYLSTTGMPEKFHGAIELARFRLEKDNLLFALADTDSLQIGFQGDAKEIVLDVAQFKLRHPTALKANLTARGKFSESTITIDGKIASEPIKQGVNLDFKSDIQFLKDEVATTTRASLAPFTLQGLRGGAAELMAKARVDADGLSGVLRYDGGELSLPTLKLSADTLNLILPFRFPPDEEKKPPAGSLKLGKIRYHGEEVAAMDASLRQQESGLQFAATASSHLVTEATMGCQGEFFSASNYLVDCSFNDLIIDTSQLPLPLQLPDALGFKGRISASLATQQQAATDATKLSLSLTEGEVSQGDLHLDGIATTVELAIPSFTSSPGQLCTIDHLSLGGVKMEDAKLRYRVEGADRLLLERAQLSWCGGKVETHALPLAKGQQDLSATLYCDRIGLSELLQQLGMNDAQGEGSLNGRLPLELRGDRVHIDDGFLFSTPGNGGIIRFNNTDQLQKGLPVAGENSSLEYAMQALENFSYNWTKLAFTTQDDELLLTMQLDGKPASPLPFGYKNGQIVASDQGGGLQHPIRLDVNFTFPLQDFFEFGQGIQALMEDF